MNIPWMFVALYILFIVCLICAAIDDCIDTNQTIRELTEELAILTVETPPAIELRPLRIPTPPPVPLWTLTDRNGNLAHPPANLILRPNDPRYIFDAYFL